MRLSVQRGDVGNYPPAMAPSVKVLLDGKEISGVVTADEEAGVVVVIPYPIKRHPDNPQAIKHDVRYGEVKIIMTEKERTNLEAWFKEKEERRKQANGSGGRSQ